MSRVTGSLVTVDRKAGPVYFLKARDRSGRQIKRRLGPVADWPGKTADDALRDWLTDLGRVPVAGEAGVTFEYAARAWLRYVEHDLERKRSTVRDYRNTVNRHLVTRFGERPVGELTTDDVDELRSVLLDQVSRRTAQKVLVLLHGILKLAARRGWATANVAADAERVTVRRRTEFAVLSPTEVLALAAKACDEQHAAVVLVAAFTGLRLGELRALRWRDVDFANRIVHVRRSFTASTEDTPKSDAARSVPLVDQAARALDGLSRRGELVGPGDHVFPGHAGAPMDDNHIRDEFYASLERAGIDRDRGTGKPLVFHDLRHSFGCLAVQAFPLSDVKAYMGHADIKTTMIYVHHTPQHNAADRLTQLVAGGAAWVPAGTQLSASEVT